MNEDSRGEVCDSLHELFELRELLANVPAPGVEQEKALCFVKKLNASAVPLCVRALSKSDAQGDFAMQLLMSMAAERANVRRRAVSELQALQKNSDLSDGVKIRAAMLLAEFGEKGQAISLKNPGKFRRQSLFELTRRLQLPRQLAKAASELLASLESDELCSLLEDLADVSGDRTAALMEEILLRDDIDDNLRLYLRRARTLLALGSSASARPLPTHGGFIGRRKMGGMVALVRDGRENPERMFVTLIAPGGALLDSHYQDDLSRDDIEEMLVAPLLEEGFCIESAPLESVRSLVCRAAKKRSQMGIRQPKDFYLGRDMIGIHDEFLPKARRLTRAADVGILFSRAIELLENRHFDLAKEALKRYVKVVPSDPEGHSGLGICLLKLGEVSPAEISFEKARSLDPENRKYTWNLAVSAQRAGRWVEYRNRMSQYLHTNSACPQIESRDELAREILGEENRLQRMHLLQGENQPRLPGF